VSLGEQKKKYLENIFEYFEKRIDRNSLRLKKKIPIRILLIKYFYLNALRNWLMTINDRREDKFVCKTNAFVATFKI